MKAFIAAIDCSRSSRFGEVMHMTAVRDGPIASIAEAAFPSSLTIEPADSGFFLFRLDEAGVCVADTWHLTLEEAKVQAEFEYAVSPDEWTQVA